MKTNAIILSIFIFFISCQSKIDGEGNANSVQEYVLDVFNEIEVNCNCNITLIPSKQSQAIIESHENLVQNFEVNLKNKKLSLKENKQVNKFNLYNINVYYNSELEKINLGKNTKLKHSGTLKSEKVKINISDSANIFDTYVDLKNLDLNLTDKSRITMTGTAINQNIFITHESIADLSNLQGVSINFKSKKNSELTIHALKDLSGTAYDNSKISYFGDPKKNISEKDRAIIQNKSL